jgi:hypothetical protein
MEKIQEKNWLARFYITTPGQGTSPTTVWSVVTLTTINSK